MPKDPSGLEHDQEGGIPSFSGQPVPVPHNSHRKEFLTSNINLPLFCLKPSPLVVSLQALVSSPSAAFLWASVRYWQAALRSACSLLFSRLISPNSLSLSSEERGSSPLIIFMASSGPAPTSPCLFLCWGLQSWTQDSGWGVTRAEQRGRILSLTLLATLLLVQHRIWLAFWAVSAYWWVTLSSSSSSTPTSFSSRLL